VIGSADNCQGRGGIASDTSGPMLNAPSLSHFKVPLISPEDLLRLLEGGIYT